jgi:hypothetical protein
MSLRPTKLPQATAGVGTYTGTSKKVSIFTFNKLNDLSDLFLLCKLKIHKLKLQ